ncbi:MAG: hypothetical protein R3208_02445 [Ketobacteraceae bacterium]|nr:hypothetical protein [Ketobacteraceae bacterium]
METSQYFPVLPKIRTLRRLALVSAGVFLLAFALPVYSLTLENGHQVMLYVMSIHLGLFILAQWLSFECKMIEYKVKLYSMSNVQESDREYYRQVIQGLPLLAAFASVLSLMILL